MGLHSREKKNLFGRKQQGLIAELTAGGTPEGKLIFKMISKSSTFLPEDLMAYIQAKIYKWTMDLQILNGWGVKHLPNTPLLT